MAVIAVINQKGGCAKSTTSVHFAYWLTMNQHRVVLVDADAQRSSSIWLESLEVEIPYEVVQTADDLLELVPLLNKEFDYVVIDGPAGLSDATRAIPYCTDLAIIPCQPTGVDLRSASDAIRLIRQAQVDRNGLPEAAVFLSRAVKGTRLKDEAIELLSNIGVPVLSTAIHQRQAVADTFGQAATAWELLGKAAVEATEEFDQLFREIMAIVPQRLAETEPQQTEPKKTEPQQTETKKTEPKKPEPNRPIKPK